MRVFPRCLAMVMMMMIVVVLRVKTSENSRISRSTKNALYNLRSSFQDEIRSFQDKKKEQNTFSPWWSKHCHRLIPCAISHRFDPSRHPPRRQERKGCIRARHTSLNLNTDIFHCLKILRVSLFLSTAVIFQILLSITNDDLHVLRMPLS